VSEFRVNGRYYGDLNHGVNDKVVI
jgi:hypothetical protein